MMMELSPLIGLNMCVQFFSTKVKINGVKCKQKSTKFLTLKYAADLKKCPNFYLTQNQ